MVTQCTEDFDIDFEEHEICEGHDKLLSAVGVLYKKQRVDVPKRTEPHAEASEFNLANNVEKKGKTLQVSVKDLAQVLNKRATHKEISKKVKEINSQSKVLPRALEKLHSDKIGRSVGYKNLKTQFSRWDAIVHRNRAADQLKFPLYESEVEVYRPNNFLSAFKKPTELELKLAEIFNSSQIAREESKKEEELFPLSIEEMIERRKMMARVRAQESYQIAKAARQNRIKSKKYHRFQRHEKMKKELKEFENLQKTDPQAALDKLQQLEKARAEERATLRHRNTGQWAKSKAIRAKYDKEARIELAEQLVKSRELTQSLKLIGNSSDDEEQNEESRLDDEQAPQVRDEVEEFISGYQKYVERNKSDTIIDNSGNQVTIVGTQEELENCELEKGSKEGNPHKVLDKGSSSISTGVAANVESQSLCSNHTMINESVDMKSTRSSSPSSELPELPSLEHDDSSKQHLIFKESSGNTNKKNLTSSENYREVTISEECSLPEDEKSKESNLDNSNNDIPLRTRISGSPPSVKDLVGSLTSECDSLPLVPDVEENKPITPEESDNLENHNKFLKSSPEVEPKEIICLEGNVKSASDNKYSSCTDSVMKIKGNVFKVSNNKANKNSLRRKKNIVDLLRKKKITVGRKTRNIEENVVQLGEWIVEEETDTKENITESDLGKVDIPKQLDKINFKKNKNKRNMEIDIIFDSLGDAFKEKCENKFKELEHEIGTPDEMDTENHDDLGTRSYKESDLSMKKSKLVADIDEAMIELAGDRVSSAPVVDLKKLANISKDDEKSEKKEVNVNINPKKFLTVKPKELLSAIPDLVTAGEEGLDDNEKEDETNKQINLIEAFAEDDIIDKFRFEKEEEVKSTKAQDIDLSLPGWGTWGGTAMPSEKPSFRRKRRMVVKVPEVQRKDKNNPNVIIREESNAKLKDHLVSELPFPFTSVKEYEASLRAPIGSTWIPETAHKKLTLKPVVTRMGTIIKPMTEKQLFKQQNRRDAKLVFKNKTDSKSKAKINK